MHLTSGLNRTSTSLRWVIPAAVIGLSCTPRQLPPTVKPDVSPPVQAPESLPVPVSHFLEPDSARYIAESQVITRDITSDSVPTVIRTDTLVLAEPIHATLSRIDSDRFVLLIASDSGYSSPTDRQPPPETILPRASIRYRTLLDQKARVQTDLYEADNSCQQTLSILTPLVSAVFARLLSSSHPTFPSPPDTLRYTTCQTGVTRHFQVTMAFRHQDDSIPTLSIAGTFSTDSSRAMPMRISGKFQGTAMALPTKGSAIFTNVTVKISADVTATAVLQNNITKHQQLTQTMLTRFVRDTLSIH